MVAWCQQEGVNFSVGVASMSKFPRTASSSNSLIPRSLSFSSRRDEGDAWCFLPRWQVVYGGLALMLRIGGGAI